MTTHAITIEIDDAKLASYADGFLAVCWHASQHNPAEYGDYMVGELVEHIGREIIRRWLRNVPPELWHHQLMRRIAGPRARPLQKRHSVTKGQDHER